MARCDSAMTTTPLMPNGLNSWKTTSTIVACARLAASTMDVFTVSRLLRASASQSNSSSSRCRPSACTLSLLSEFRLPAKILRACFLNVGPCFWHCKEKMAFLAPFETLGDASGAGSGVLGAVRRSRRAAPASRVERQKSRLEGTFLLAFGPRAANMVERFAVFFAKIHYEREATRANGLETGNQGSDDVRKR